MSTKHTTAKAEQAGQIKPVKVTLYRWAGKWGPFKVKMPCGECALTSDILKDTFENELAGIPVELEVREWLSEWYRPLLKGGWHAPIVFVEDEIISQGHALNRGLLAEAITKHYVARTGIEGTVVFGKATCPHCTRAKQLLDASGIAYTYRDVVKDPRALYEMIPRVKDKIGHHTPVTVPQVWLDGTYVGGADHLAERLAPADRKTEAVDTTLAAPGALAA